MGTTINRHGARAPEEFGDGFSFGTGQPHQRKSGSTFSNTAEAKGYADAMMLDDAR
ncbi:hypothetical protein GGQ65_001322 [Rhizobium fabae]|uniref:Uncharacterized protein n=1 Tax=Rhizobium fabae TaxID=573179 RepID=A0A7W6B1Y9_9HYPH|nr:hypothetical protein [Rhizobium fabae]MBB3914052.1 hypothetical protein [Rhizobium fabae]